MIAVPAAVIPAAFRRRALATPLALAVAFGLGACGGPVDDDGAPPPGGAPWFQDVSEAVGLTFEHVSGATGELYIVEVMGAGAGWLDADGDGDLDAYLVQGNALDLASRDPDVVDRLFLNEPSPEGGRRFVDVTEASGLRNEGYGMGVAVGDVDGDGWDDLYVTQYGANRLYRSLGPGPDGLPRFEDVTEVSGTGDPRWSVGASFFDADGDGDLDLFVANYVDFSAASHRPCHHPSSALDYCGPGVYRAEVDRFYRNLGTDADGRPRFEDATAAAGLAAAHGPGLGVVAADFDGDRLTEIYVANDAADNQWWVPRAGDPGAPAGFRDDAPMAGCAVNGAGQREASMGVAVGDLDGDLDLDLFLTHLDGESHTLYDNRGGHFADVTRARGLETPTWPHTGFGTGAVDVDNDGRLDLLVVHGAVKRFSEARTETADGVPTLGQPNHLLRQGPDGVFEDVSLRGGPAFALAEVSRGAAFADYDDDGDLDVLITNNDGPARLLENRVGQDHPWIGLDLRTQGGGAADGAVVLVTCGDGARFLRRAARDGSYASANDPRILVGLGGGSGPCGAEIRWPDGSTESFADLVAGRYHRLEQGSGDSSSGRPGDSNAS